MTADLNKYEVLLTSGNCNTIFPEQYQIVYLTTVVEKLKDNNIKISKLVKTSPGKTKG